ncbi:phosphate/phosphite/phosphonate ABC transporter substrate-binding protein [Salinigranum halophilum]|jgi:phosphonate transport system substrate-binding protein|uniref:phosphate/phosphite/phosphonate ABC transporter substrate-binding protein n=1 Tax=Salinigranum halophilum TaxID=2565931 RepID=UPI00115D62A8|nr:phosphate/phosphite/phosphonate ABC transporter substrate-binding protein [Salinigranum halophilum]
MRKIDRRKFVSGVSAVTLASIAGCSGGGGDSSGGGGSEGTSSGGDSGGGSGGGSSGGDSSGGEEMPAHTDPSTYPEFDPASPEFPQLLSTLLETGFETGSLSDLERLQENPRDEPRYGQPVAETPDDESEWLDPDTLEFSLTPTEDPTVYEDTLRPLLDNIAEETGKEVNYASLDSYAAQVEAMRSERLHLAGFSTGAVPYAVNIGNAVPFSVQIDGSGENGSFGYRLFLITQVDNPDIGSLEDLAGDPMQNVAHADPSSNSGNLAPRALFANEGVVPGEDYEVSYSGGHQQSSLGVANGDYEAAPVCSTCIARVARDDQLDPSQIKAVYASEPFPTTAFSYVNTLHPDIQEGVRAAFLDYDYQDTSIAEEFEGRGTWVEIDYATVWDIILQIQESLEVEYETGNLSE